MKHATIYSHEPKFTGVFTGDTLRSISAYGVLVIGAEFAPELIKLAAAEGIKWSLDPLPDNARAAGFEALTEAERHLAVLGQQGHVIPFGLIRDNLDNLPKTVWLQLAEAVGANPLLTIETSKAEIIQDILTATSADSTNGRSPEYSSGEAGSTPASATNPAAPVTAPVGDTTVNPTDEPAPEVTE